MVLKWSYWSIILFFNILSPSTAVTETVGGFLNIMSESVEVACSILHH